MRTGETVNRGKILRQVKSEKLKVKSEYKKGHRLPQIYHRDTPYNHHARNNSRVTNGAGIIVDKKPPF